MFVVHVSLPFTLDFLSAFVIGGCQLSLFALDAFLLHMSVPPLIGLTVLASYTTSSAGKCCLKGTNAVERAHNRQSRKQLSIKTIIFITQLMYPGLASRVFSTFRCREFPGVLAVLASDFSVECHTGRHALFEALSVLFMVLYVFGMPFGAFLSLWYHRKHLNDPASPRHDMVKFMFGALFEQFEPAFWWFGK